MMALYATVTSERASKGQGGSFLNIEIKGEDGARLVYLIVNQSVAEPDRYEMSIEDRSSYLDIVEDGAEIGAKSALQKCNNHVGWCAEHQTRHGIESEKTKGEKQKGERCKEKNGVTRCIYTVPCILHG